MTPVLLFLCCVLLSPIAAFPRNAQKGDLTFPSPFTEPETPPNVLSSQTPLPYPKSCQDLLHKTPSLAPLPEYLSSLALRVALEEVGCPTEAHILELQLFKMGGKDTTETFIREIQKHKAAEWDSDIKTILRDMVGSPGDLGRVRRSATIPEECKEEGWVFYETAKLLIEFAEKLPPSELVTEFKNTAVNVTQKCTLESWEHVLEVGEKLMTSPELKNFSMPIEEEISFVVRFIIIMKHAIWKMIQGYLEIY
ncbi:apolipoprotein F-like [Choloepus didactylus]|uniref:apolipoprotein F-like n=1 Tax=Choloepus didactylus TaxID=27675 RepID=UPI00189F8DD4|nr:apolipoprotein F-like [Choloepus didactylus]XP_037704106.1 apolipoprotein F-like [Choloepus didactylus]